jgi:hypothetical protein
MKLKPLGANRTEITLADGTVVLFSYQTPVAAFIPGRGYFRTEKHHSRTTSKHIGQWLSGTLHAIDERPQAFFERLARRAS